MALIVELYGLRKLKYLRTKDVEGCRLNMNFFSSNACLFLLCVPPTLTTHFSLSYTKPFLLYTYFGMAGTKQVFGGRHEAEGIECF